MNRLNMLIPETSLIIQVDENQLFFTDYLSYYSGIFHERLLCQRDLTNHLVMSSQGP